MHRNYLDQHRVAIVCSARSGSTKALGTTNLLLRAASEALQPSTRPSTPGVSGLQTPFWGSPGSPLQTPSIQSASLTALTQINGTSGSVTGSPPYQPLNGLSLPAQSAPDFSFSSTVDLIRTEHISAARLTIRDVAILRELEADLERDCDGLRNFLFAAQVRRSDPKNGRVLNARPSGHRRDISAIA